MDGVCNIVQEAVTKTIPKKKKCKKATWLFEEALQIAEKGREAESKRERDNIWLRPPDPSFTVVLVNPAARIQKFCSFHFEIP